MTAIRALPVVVATTLLLAPAFALAGAGGSSAPAVPALVYVIAQVGLIVFMALRRR